MNDPVTNIAGLRGKATELKTPIAEAQGEQGSRLREAQYHLEAAIFVMERNAAELADTMSRSGQPKAAKPPQVERAWPATGVFGTCEVTAAVGHGTHTDELRPR